MVIVLLEYLTVILQYLDQDVILCIELYYRFFFRVEACSPYVSIWIHHCTATPIANQRVCYASNLDEILFQLTLLEENMHTYLTTPVTVMFILIAD